MDTIGNYIAGRLQCSDSKNFGKVYNPCTGEVIKQVVFSSVATTQEAISVAKEAFACWSTTPAVKRARILFKFKALVEDATEDLARLISSEHGKVFSDAKAEIIRGLEVVDFACGIPRLFKGEYTENVGTGVDSWSLMQPLGVCVGIVPFNFPVMIPLWLATMAIACGNSFVLKPSEKVPSAALKLAQLLQEAGLPGGVFNVVNGDKTVVDTLLSDPEVKAISFVGSSPVARHVYQTGCAYGKRVQAFGGAKNHMVVLPDADLESATNALLGAAFGSAGERCMAISVAVPVGEETAQRMVDILVPKIEALRVGPSLDVSPENDLGPLITQAHRNRVYDYVDQGEKEGARLLIDGRLIQVASGQGGFYFGPSLFDHVTPTMRIYREEIFGPVLAVTRVQHVTEAMELINAHELGNGTAIFTRDGHMAHQFAKQIQVGMVGINIPIPVPAAFHGFGGWKHSRFGSLRMYGADAVRFYSRMKMVTARWPEPSYAHQVEFSMPTTS